MTESKPLPTIELDGVTWEPTLLHGDPGEKAWTKAMTTEHLTLLLKGMPAEERNEVLASYLGVAKRSGYVAGMGALHNAMPAPFAEPDTDKIIARVVGYIHELDHDLRIETERADRAEAKLLRQSAVIDAALAVRAWARDGRAFVPNCVSSLGDALDEAEAKLREMEGK